VKAKSVGSYACTVATKAQKKLGVKKEMQPTIKISKVKCKKCGHKWVPKIKNPKRCPVCKNKWWEPYQRKNKRRKKHEPD